MTKKWYKSKTIWFSIAIGIVGVVEANSGALQAMLTPAVYGISMIAISSIGVVLRTVTNTNIGDTDDKQ
jgi:hypothetical protein